MNALWWWIDRWRKSTAFTDMTLDQQGAYRNLLDEATLRGGAIPDDERVLAKASGDAVAWPAVRDVVLARFTLRKDGWHNVTLDEVIRQGKRRAKNQKAYRGRKRDNASDNGADNSPDNDAAIKATNKPASPDPDLSVPPSKNDGGSAPPPVRVQSTPLISVHQNRAYARSVERQHAACAPDLCVIQGAPVQKCMPATTLDWLARSIVGVSHEAALLRVTAWALADRPPAGEYPASDFDYWKARWEARRPRSAEPEDRRGDGFLEMVRKSEGVA